MGREVGLGASGLMVELYVVGNDGLLVGLVVGRDVVGWEVAV